MYDFVDHGETISLGVALLRIATSIPIFFLSDGSTTTDQLTNCLP
jgi:hypothetical protein